jgi:hypothetical protein
MKINQIKAAFILLISAPVVPIMFFLILPLSLNGQTGGRAYQFLEMTNSARIAGIGGTAASNNDDDLNFSFHNPSLLNSDMHHRLVLNYVDYYAGINYGYASFAVKMPKKGTFAGGVHYLNYGKFQGADENGNLTGTFRAADYSFNFYWALPLDSMLTAGIAVKSIYSDLESYKSTAVAFDIGISYNNPGKNFSAGLVVRNAGLQVSAYYPFGDREPMPFNIMAGITQGLAYAPLKFYITAEHLEKWDLTYEIENEGTASDYLESPQKKGTFDVFFDRFMRHIVAGAEFQPGKNLVFRAGYNYRRRQEMKISSKPGMVGFSWGIGMKISRFRIDYARSSWHLAGGINYFSLSLNLDEFGKKF